MSLSIGSVNYNSPSFNGIVKVAGVYLDGKEVPIGTDYFADEETKKKNEALVDKATKGIKAILMKKADNPPTWENFGVFRRIYHFFDRDYKIRTTPPKDDGRDIFSKVRTKDGDVFLTSGDDAATVASSGRNIGSKRRLELDYPEGNYGVEEAARSNYGDDLNSIARKYKKNPAEPSIYIYLRTIKAGKKSNKEKIILSSARMEDINHDPYINSSGWTQTIYFDRQMIFSKKPQAASTTQAATSTDAAKITSPTRQEAKTVSDKTTQSKPAATDTTSKKQSVEMSKKKKEENPILEELSHKSWDSALARPKKRKKRIPKKYRDLPGQQVFDLK